MKKNKNAFTLIELMVVIAIVAILAAIMASAVVGAMARADKTTAQNMVYSIQSAVENYKTEYGDWPREAAVMRGQSMGGGDVILVADTELKALFAILGSYDVEKGESIEGLGDRAVKTLLDLRNGRRVNFITLDGDDYSTALPLDPWGNKYYVALDTDYDGLIEVDYDGSNRVIRAGCFVMSCGADGQPASPWSEGFPAAYGKNGGIYSYNFGD